MAEPGRKSRSGVVATLSQDIISTVRSGIAISSAGQCVEELVLNGIDANATQIFVGVDFRKFRIRVEDNGFGILKNDLVQIGTRYSTSKCHTLDDLNNLHSYGFRGEALASIIDTADEVEILSRSMYEEFSCRKTFRNGVPDERIVEEHSSQRKTQGLSITIINFMGKFPVRQRRIDDFIEIEEIKSILERILVMNPLIALEYRNDATGAKILSVSHSPSVEIAFRKIFIQSRHGLALHENLMEVHFSHFVYFLKLYVSKGAHHSKDLELVYVNRRYMARGKIHRALHQLLSNLFGFEGRKSTTTNEDEDQSNSKNRSTSFGFKSETKSNVNKYPLFILSIECPLNEYDITFDPKKTVVEFKHWSVLMEAIGGLKDRLKLSLKLEANKSIVVSKHSTSKSSNRDSSQCHPVACSSKGATATATKGNDCKSKELERVGKNITIHAMKSSVHSRVAVRGRGTENGNDSDNKEPENHNESSSNDIMWSSESEENPDVKSKDVKTKNSSKLHLSTLELKSLKRGKTTEDTSVVLSKKLCSIPKKSTGPGVGVLKNIKEKFSPWRVMLEGKEATDKKKSLPWRGIPAKRKSTNDDVLSDKDKLRRLSMTHSDPDSPSTSNDNPKSSTLNRLPEHKKKSKSKSRHLSSKKRRATFEESDNVNDHSIEDQDQEDTEISQIQNDKSHSQKPNQFNFQNKIVLVDATETSSSGTESADEKLVGSRFMYDVLDGHMDELLANGYGIERFRDSSAPLRSVRNHTLNILGQMIEENELKLKERSHVSESPPSAGQPLKSSRESSSVGAVRLPKKESKEEETKTKEPSAEVGNIGYLTKADIRRVLDKLTNEMKEKVAQRQECRERMALGSDHQRFIGQSSSSSPLPKNQCPENDDEEIYKLKIDEDRQKLKDEIDSGHHAFYTRVHSADPPSDDAASTLRLIKWLKSSNRRRWENPFEPLANEQMVLPTPVHEYDPILPPNKKQAVPIHHSQYLSLSGSDLASEGNQNCTSPLLFFEDFPPDLTSIPPQPLPQPLPQMKREVTATVTSATTLLAVNDLDPPILGQSYFTPKQSTFRVSYQENSRYGFWEDFEEAGHVSVQLNLDSNVIVPIVPPSPQEFHAPFIPTNQIQDQTERQVQDIVQKSVYFSPAIEINTNNTVEMEDDGDDEIEEEEIGRNNVNEIPTSIPPQIEGRGEDTVEKSVYFSQPEEMNLNNTVEMEEDNKIDIEGEPGLQDSPQDTSQYFQPFEEIDEPEIEGAVANEGQSEIEICSKWADWEFEISVDVMGQEWLHTTDEFGHLKYVNLGTGNSSDHIVQVTGYEKLTAAQAKLLNKTFRYNWLCKYFPKGSNKFWNPTATEDGKISKNGNMDLAHEGSTILGSSIRHCMKGEIEKIASKWKEGHLEESLCGGNCHNPENVMDNENYPTDSSMSEVVRVCEYWERPTGSPQVPILNLNGPDINFFIKRADKQSCRFSKTDLNDVRVISQLDRKFIVTTNGNTNQNQGEQKTLLVLFDQHAVHERIRLEQLLAECFREDEPGVKTIVSVSVDPPIILTFEETESRILMNYRDQMKNLGVEYYFKDDGSINIASVPKCFAQKIANETYATRNNTMKRLLFSLLREQVNLILDRNGLVQNVPKTIFDILCSQACHGAIKFGDALSLDVCQALLNKLKDCVVPFQCAHGRPVLVPTTDLKIQRPSSSEGLLSNI